jgi:TRAP-type C4-dicarboxylate transport system permease large subunit
MAKMRLTLFSLTHKANFSILLPRKSNVLSVICLPGFAVVIAILLLYIPVGMLLGAIPMVLLTVPVVSPVVQNLGFNLIWFGVLVVLMAEVAFISPPVGIGGLYRSRCDESPAT